MDSKINNKEIVGIVIDELEKRSIIKKNYSTYKNTERILYDYPKLKDTIVERKEQIKELSKDNQKLSKQLDYLRSGEYINQLKFERDMLQHVVDNGKVSEEDKNFIDMTHRNTELLEENQSLKDQVAYLRRDIERQEAKITDLENERIPYTNEYVDKVKEVHNKAIEIIKDNIPEEYVRSCDTADYIGRYELDTDTWQYKVYEMLKEVE